MKRSSKVILCLFALIFLGLAIYAYSIFRERVSSPETRDGQKDSTIIIQDQDPLDASSGEPIIDNSAVDPDEVLEDENVAPEGNNFLDVSKADCNNNCKEFTDPADLTYCQQTCGISEVKKDVAEKNECDKLNDLEKDYCFKDLAITKKDIQICAQISDTNIFKTCKNRIAQDMIESQK